ncbi:hypothetical protein MSSAC_1428 [Methanosarcina siciliae C2J]|uniref:PEF-CTERM protein sorting domain-containing protein n=2 Tax=Methanosarcina siciliae TaxID=38027 RepID=A0A0E3PLM7_9EURY|nr:hypothetical protein [Methanosarcina siciliae]AKB36018.1 hypothetical protein MSSAC_1428 [Methanosarcina siciliae C2J]
MRSNKMKIGLVLLLSLLTINTASANPGFNVDVETTSSTVGPGGTVTYAVTLTAMTALDVEEFADLSVTVTDPDGNPVSWTTTFSDNLFLIGPYPSEKTVTLEVTVPEGTPAGEYQIKILGEGYLPDFIDPTIPDEFLGSIESSEFPITVTVTQIPEFPTIALPAISALGIVFLASRKREGNS